MASSTNFRLFLLDLEHAHVTSFPDSFSSLVIKAGVHLNLNEVLRGLKKGYPRKSTPGCQQTVLVSIY